MKNVYIAGEDSVTREIIYRLLKYCSPDFYVIQDCRLAGVK